MERDRPAWWNTGTGHAADHVSVHRGGSPRAAARCDRDTIDGADSRPARPPPPTAPVAERTHAEQPTPAAAFSAATATRFGDTRKITRHTPPFAATNGLVRDSDPIAPPQHKASQAQRDGYERAC